MLMLIMVCNDTREKEKTEKAKLASQGVGEKETDSLPVVRQQTKGM